MGMKFCVFNTVEGESFGVPGVRNYLHDTYVGDIMKTVFLERVADSRQEYTLKYNHPVKSLSKYHSYLWISFDHVYPEDLDEISTLLSATFTEVIEKIPGVKEKSSSTHFRLFYRERDWPDDKYCLIDISPFTEYKWNKDLGVNELIQFNADADAIR